MEYSVILWDRLQIIMKRFGAEREDRGSSEHHMSSKFMVNAYQNSGI